MKTACLSLFIFAAFAGIYKAQVVFCPPGANWNYNWAYSFTPWPQARYNDQITYTKDTIIGIDTLKKLEHNFFSFECLTYSCSPTLIKQKGDTIFMRNPCLVGTWQILYNFASTPGSGWQNIVKRSPNSALTCTYNIAVTSVSTVTVNGLQLKQLSATYQFNYGNISSTSNEIITERFGSSRYLFNFRNHIATDCNYISNFLCYKDDAIGKVHFSQLPCDYANPVGITEQVLNPFTFSVFPNPGGDFIEIHTDFTSGNLSIQLTDLAGRIIKQFAIEKSGLINTVDLDEGFYFLSAFSADGGLLGQCKFLKSR